MDTVTKATLVASPLNPSGPARVSQHPRFAVSALALVMAIFTVAACSGPSRARLRPNATTTTRAAPATAQSTTGPDRTGPQRDEPALPLAIQELAVTVASDRLFAIGGYDAAHNSSAAVFVFGGTSWSPGPSLPVAVNHSAAATIGNDVYVAGGFTASGATSRVFVLKARATSWQELPPLSQARGALALLALGGRLYAIGGRDGQSQITTPEVYDPVRAQWSDIAPMPRARNHIAGYIDGSVACVAGGREPATSSAIDCFDPATGAWHSQKSLPTPTSGAAAAALAGVTLVAGGEPGNETSVYGSIQELRNGSWSAVPMLTPRHGTGFAIYHDRLWMCGGATQPGFHAVAGCTSAAL